MEEEWVAHPLGTAFAASMAEAQRRANIASTLGLSLQERVQMLKVWILLVVLLLGGPFLHIRRG